MKQTLPIIFLLFVICACKKSDNTNSGGSPAPVSPSSASFFSAKVNNRLHTADSAYGYMSIDSAASIPIRVFSIDAYCDSQIIAPSFFDNSTSSLVPVLNYDSLGAGAYMGYADGVGSYVVISATFKITSSDTVHKKISGSFSGVMVDAPRGDTVFVTDGIFTNISY